jgi:hypothetical protein
MTEGLRIRIVDPDDDYLGIEIQVSNGRFAGSTRIFAGLEQLTEFSAKIAGFPTNPDDERIYEFGSRESKIAGGYGRMRFHCIDHKGHAAIEVILEDDDKYYSAASAPEPSSGSCRYRPLHQTVAGIAKGTLRRSRTSIVGLTACYAVFSIECSEPDNSAGTAGVRAHIQEVWI